MSEVMEEECHLEGGPEYMPESLRTILVPMDCLEVKVQFRNGWEHFERINEFTDVGLPIFDWTMRTMIAE